MYVGRKSLRALRDFIYGYQMACNIHSIEKDELGLNFPHGFHDWVAYRTHYRESTSGWCNMILETTDSEEQAIDRFFELLEEYARRTPKVVAEILGPTSNIETGLGVPIPPPSKVELVQYTTDPGFFALYNNEQWHDQFYPFLGWMYRMYGFSGGDLVIHNQEAYDQLVIANEAYNRKRREDWMSNQSE